MTRSLTFLASIASMQADAFMVTYYVNELAGIELLRRSDGGN